jgi:hypothetical protein
VTGGDRLLDDTKRHVFIGEETHYAAAVG